MAQRNQERAIMANVPEDKDLLKIAEAIGHNWEMLAPYLITKNPTGTVEQIEMDESTKHMRKYKLLIIWRQEAGDKASFEELFHHMLQAGTSVTIEWGDIAKSLKIAEKDIRACKHEVGDKRLHAGTGAFKESVAQPTPFQDKGKWADCIAQKDEKAADELIEQNSLPTNEELIRVCNEFGRTSITFSKVCNKISENIRKESDKIIDAWASYRVSDLDKDGRITSIHFVISCKDSSDESINVEISNYKIEFRCATSFSEESEDILEVELSDVASSIQNEQEDKQNEQKDFEELRKIICKHADKLMDDHSNVSIISPSSKRSTGFGTEHQIIDEPCIAIYVSVKGFIPIEEDPLPKKIDGYCVDVLEGEFDPFNGGPTDYHDKLKLGLAIHADIRNSDNELCKGTLGGFLEHPDHGLCGLTCAHVVSLEDEFVNKGTIYPEDRQVFQPIDSSSTPFGEVALIHHHAGNSCSPGMEVALIKINERQPESGIFPDSNLYGMAGFNNSRPLTYKSQIARHTDVFKFGMKTEITQGSYRSQGAVMRTGTYRLKDQIEICRKSTDVRFADPGDSGALVFVQDNGDSPVAIGIVAGGKKTNKI